MISTCGLWPSCSAVEAIARRLGHV
jgi:hypothetical protein